MVIVVVVVGVAVGVVVYPKSTCLVGSHRGPAEDAPQSICLKQRTAAS